MAYLREELTDILSAAEQQRQQQRVRQLKYTQSMGDNVSELQADPRWEKFFRPIGARHKLALSALETVNGRLLTGVLSSDEYIKHKMTQVSLKGEIGVYEFVVGLAKNLIDAGNQAKEELEKVG